MNEHLMITKVEKEGSLPKGEPVAAPPVETETVCDPRNLLMTLEVEFADVVVGDWVAAPHWSRPRRVEFMDLAEDGSVLYLAEPDTARTDKHGMRRVSSSDWHDRGPSWRQFPALRLLWEAAHGES